MPPNKPIPESPHAAPLESLFDEAQTPVYAIDHSGVIVYANAALCDWLVAPVDQIVGSRVEYHSDAPQETGAIGADLCPPPPVLAGAAATAVLAVAMHDKNLKRRTFRFSPLPGLADNGPTSRPAVLAIGDAGDVPADAQDQHLPGDPFHLAIRRFRAEQSAARAIDPLLGVSPTTAHARRQATAAIQARANCMVAGPTGAGQARVARAIHYAAADADAGLWQFSCRGMRAEELERILQKADRSATLLAAQLDQLTPETQHALVRMLASRREQPRLLATIEAPSQGVPPALAPGLAALFGVEVRLPRLADRLEDLPWLAQLFIEQCNAGSKHQVGSIEAAALDQLALYAWPGNVDQLAGVIAEAHASATYTEVRVADLPALIRHAAVAAATLEPRPEQLDLTALLARVERELLERALRRAEGNRSQAARSVGMTRAKFYRRLKELGIEPTAEEGRP